MHPSAGLFSTRRVSAVPGPLNHLLAAPGCSSLKLKRPLLLPYIHHIAATRRPNFAPGLSPTLSHSLTRSATHLLARPPSALDTHPETQQSTAVCALAPERLRACLPAHWPCGAPAPPASLASNNPHPPFQQHARTTARPCKVVVILPSAASRTPTRNRFALPHTPTPIHHTHTVSLDGRFLPLPLERWLRCCAHKENCCELPAVPLLARQRRASATPPGTVTRRT
jgi:hypothetical protein